MSYFTTTRCPKCGETKQHHLSGLGFYDEENTICSHCGHTYLNSANRISAHVEISNPHVNSNRLTNVLIDNLKKGDINLFIVSTDKLQKALDQCLAGFSTAELERELQRKSL